MDLQFINENFRTFKRTELDGWGDPLNGPLEALFGDLISLHYDVTFSQLIDRSRAAVYTMFDLAHDSDESCEMHIVAIDDKPLGLAFRSGDDTPWHSRVMDVELFKLLAVELSTAALEKRLTTVGGESIESLSSLENQYLYFLGSKETMFAVRSPKWMCGFHSLLATHRGYFVDETGQALLVEGIGKFTNNKQHSSDADAHDVSITVAGQGRVVDGTQLMFELVPGAGDIEDALGSYATAPCWVVEGVDTRNKQANVLLRRPFRWSTDTLNVAFDSDEELKRFAEAHFDHDKPEREQLVHSEFDLNAMGYSAREVYRC